MRGLLDVQRLQPLVAPDAVIQVNHQVPGRQGRSLGQEVRRPPLLAWPRQTVAQDVGLGNDRDLVRRKPMLDRQDAAQIQVLRRGLDIGPVAHGDDMIQAVVGQHGRQTFRRALGPRGEQHPLAVGLQRRSMGRHRLEQVDAVLRPLGRKGPTQSAARILAAARERRKPPHGATRQGLVPVAGVQIQRPGRKRPIGRRMAPTLAFLSLGGLCPPFIGVGDQVPPLGPRALSLIVQEDLGLVRQIVEQRIQRLVEQRQPLLHALTPRALADGRIQGIVARRPEQLQIAGTEARDRIRVQQGLRHGRQRHRRHLAGRSLCLGIEGADRFQLGPEHVQPHRLLEARRIDIHHPAPHRELAALRHGRGPDIAVGGEIPLQRLDIEIAANLRLEPGLGRHRLRRRPLHGRTDGRDHQNRRVARLALG